MKAADDNCSQAAYTYFVTQPRNPTRPDSPALHTSKNIADKRLKVELKVNSVDLRAAHTLKI
jgi:hypothetical protein